MAILLEGMFALDAVRADSLSKEASSSTCRTQTCWNRAYRKCICGVTYTASLQATDAGSRAITLRRGLRCAIRPKRVTIVPTTTWRTVPSVGLQMDPPRHVGISPSRLRPRQRLARPRWPRNQIVKSSSRSASSSRPFAGQRERDAIRRGGVPVNFLFD
jgi:hypothetical protein